MLTAEGFEAKRAADFLVIVRDAYEARLATLGLPTDVDWEYDVLFGELTAILATLLGTESEGVGQAVYDALDPNNAIGIMLDNLCLMVGVRRREATYSQVTLSITGTNGTFIALGRLVEGGTTSGGVAGKARWTVTSEATIAGGVATVTARAVDIGATIAAPGDITKIATPVAGWSTVTNAAAASTGTNIETDAELRKRRQISLALGDGINKSSLRAQLLQDIDAVQAAVVVENDSAVAATVQGIAMDASSQAVVIWPDTLTDEQLAEVFELIFRKTPTGIKLMGDVTGTVLMRNGMEKVIRIFYATELPKTCEVVLVLDAETELADVEDAVSEIVVDYFLSLGVGDAARRLDLLALIAAIDGIVGATVTFDGAGADVVPTITQLVTLDGAPDVSV